MDIITCDPAFVNPIIEFVKVHPGTHSIRAIARELEMPYPTCRYRIHRLVDIGRLRIGQRKPLVTGGRFTPVYLDHSYNQRSAEVNQRLNQRSGRVLCPDFGKPARAAANRTAACADEKVNQRSESQPVQNAQTETPETLIISDTPTVPTVEKSKVPIHTENLKDPTKHQKRNNNNILDKGGNQGTETDPVRDDIKRIMDCYEIGHVQELNKPGFISPKDATALADRLYEGFDVDEIIEYGIPGFLSEPTGSWLSNHNFSLLISPRHLGTWIDNGKTISADPGFFRSWSDRLDDPDKFNRGTGTVNLTTGEITPDDPNRKPGSTDTRPTDTQAVPDSDPGGSEMPAWYREYSAGEPAPGGKPKPERRTCGAVDPSRFSQADRELYRSSGAGA